MAKRSTKKKTVRNALLAPALPGVVISTLLAAVAFGVYGPSLKSGFVYDARYEIFQEAFITSLSNLPAVLSLKVLGMHLTLGPRPGQMLYLMLIAAVCGKEPLGYHLGSNLLHAANVALLFVLLGRLLGTERTDPRHTFKARLAAAVVTLIFAVHPIGVESVAEISYSSSLLVTFFTLTALLAASAFPPENLRRALSMGGVGTLCAFAAAASKESGMAAAFLLIVYWFLYRRKEARGPWLLFLGSALAVTLAFLAARFLCAAPDHIQVDFLGGSFSQVFLIQPGLWVFMMGKLLWPARLSADYTPENWNGLSTPITFVILAVVVGLQLWLAGRSRLGALGIAIYWLGLVAVSNFFPLFCPLADRFYYLPLAGAAMQLLALLLMTLPSRGGFWLAVTPLLIALVPLTVLTLAREQVFASEFSLWSDTLQVSSLSSIAHNNLGNVFSQQGRLDEAAAQYQTAFKISPDNAEACNNLGSVFFKQGRVDEAMAQFQKALEIDPDYAEAHSNLGAALTKKGRIDEAIDQFRKALEIDPHIAEIHNDLGFVLFQKGRLDEAIAQFQEALRLKPGYGKAQNNLAQAKARQGTDRK